MPGALSGFLRNTMRVSYNGITSAFQADDAGSIPATRSRIKPKFKQGYNLS